MDASIEARSGIDSRLDAPEPLSGALAGEIEELARQFEELLRGSGAVPGAVSGSLPGAALSGSEALAAAAMVERMSRLVESAQVALAGRVDDDSDRPLGEPALAHRYGCTGTVELLQRVTRAPAREISRRLRLAASVLPRPAMSGGALAPRVPHVAEAFAAGEISFECAAMITRTLEQSEAVAASETLEVAERELVAAATGSDGKLPEHDDGMRTMCQVWKAFLDQDGPEPNETVPEHRRGLRLGLGRDGLVRVSGALLPEAGAALGRLLDAMNAPSALRRVARQESGADSGEPGADARELQARGLQAQDFQKHSGVRFELVEDSEAEAGNDLYADTGALPAEVDRRTADQKRHDAFAAVLEIAMQSPGVPDLGGAPVTVMIQVEQRDVEQRRGVGWVQGHDGVLAPVPMHSVRRAACTGAVQRMVRDELGRIIELGSAQRVFNAHQRRAIALRDGGCIIPGCRVPATWCEIHHVTEHAKGGLTHTDNGVLLCWHHHRGLESSGWSIRMNDGLPEVRAPNWVDSSRRWYRTGSPLRAPSHRSRDRRQPDRAAPELPDRELPERKAG
ncbi:DUF222 domain-containing protein [Leucobacter sp. GX0328]